MLFWECWWSKFSVHVSKFCVRVRCWSSVLRLDVRCCSMLRLPAEGSPIEIGNLNSLSHLEAGWTDWPFFIWKQSSQPISWTPMISDRGKRVFDKIGRDARAHLPKWASKWLYCGRPLSAFGRLLNWESFLLPEFFFQSSKLHFKSFDSFGSFWT